MPGSLVAQQSSPSSAPPQEGEGGSSAIQSLMGGGQQPQGGAQGGPGQPPAPPPADYKTTVAALKHIHAFDTRWRTMLSDKGVGTKSLRSDFYDNMADLMGAGYCSLAQTMTLLKTFPAEPLEQKQWLEQHVQQDEHAQQVLLLRYAEANPPQGGQEIESQLPKGSKDLDPDHLKIIGGLVDAYTAHHPKKSHSKPQGGNGIPLRRQ